MQGKEQKRKEGGREDGEGEDGRNKEGVMEEREEELDGDEGKEEGNGGSD